MEETEVPLEHVQEHIEHQAQHGAGWIAWSALLSAILAVLAAVGALNSGHHANEAMMQQIRSSDQWAFFQAKGIKSAVLETRVKLLAALQKESDASEKLAEYAKEQKEIKEKAEELENESKHHFELHETFAQSVTLMQIAIAVTAIAVLSRKKQFIFVSIAFGAVATFFLIKGFLLG